MAAPLRLSFEHAGQFVGRVLWLGPTPTVELLAHLSVNCWEARGSDGGKDVTEHGSFAAAGQGDVDWERYLTLLDGSGYTGALVMHGLDEAHVAGSTAFLGGLLDAGA